MRNKIRILASCIAVLFITADIRLNGSEVTSARNGSIQFTGTTASQVACQEAPYSATIQSWKILGNASGSAQFDIWIAAFGSSLPTSANSIVASAPPILSSAVTATSSTLTGWTTGFAKGNTVCVSITSLSSLSSVALSLLVQ
jgi:hypothetical protein